MKWWWIVIVGVLLLGPLRRWFGRHWAFLASATGGALFGLVLGALVLRTCGGPAYLPLLWGAVGAIALGHRGPSVLRRIERDGRDDGTTRRH